MMRMIAAKPEGNGGKKPPLLLALGSRSSHGSLSSLHSSLNPLHPPGFALREGTTGGVTDHRAQARDGGRVERRMEATK